MGGKTDIYKLMIHILKMG